MLGWLITLCARALAWTWRVAPPGPEALAQRLAQGPVVIAMLHGEMLPLVLSHRGLPLTGLVSQSDDGALAARVATGLGFQVIRGSSSSGAAEALSQARESVASGRSPAFTVDGPRGPAGVPRFGVLSVSRATGAPIWWIRAHVDRAWRLGSWDRFCVPLPFARVRFTHGELPPPGPGREALDDARRVLQQRLSG